MLGTGIHFSSNTKPGGAPFSTTDAENGLSVSTGLGTTPIGKIQLGNLLGDPLQQGKLLDTMEIPMNGQQLRFTNAGNGDNTILIGTSIFNFLDNGVSSNQSGLSPGQLFLICDDYNTIAGGAIQIMDVLTLTQLELNLENLGGLANFVLDITDGASFRQTINKDLMTITGAIQTANPGSGVGRWKVGDVINAAVALDITKYVEVEINGAVIKLGIVA